MVSSTGNVSNCPVPIRYGSKRVSAVVSIEVVWEVILSDGLECRKTEGKEA
jgi:hypothetical protein